MDSFANEERMVLDEIAGSGEKEEKLEMEMDEEEIEKLVIHKCDIAFFVSKKF